MKKLNFIVRDMRYLSTEKKGWAVVCSLTVPEQLEIKKEFDEKTPFEITPKISEKDSYQHYYTFHGLDKKDIACLVRLELEGRTKFLQNRFGDNWYYGK